MFAFTRWCNGADAYLNAPRDLLRVERWPSTDKEIHHLTCKTSLLLIRLPQYVSLSEARLLHHQSIKQTVPTQKKSSRSSSLWLRVWGRRFCNRLLLFCDSGLFILNVCVIHQRALWWIVVSFRKCPELSDTRSTLPQHYRRVMEMLVLHWLYAKWRIHYRSDRGLFFFPLLSFMEAESVEVHCWTSQIDKVKMYGGNGKGDVFYTCIVLYLFISPWRSLMLFKFVLQLAKCIYIFFFSHYFTVTERCIAFTIVSPIYIN